MKSIIAKPPLELVPVIEVEPYALTDLPIPDECPAREYPSAWRQYFDSCMVQLGEDQITPIADWSHFVRAKDMLGAVLLEKLLRDCLPDDATKTDEIAGLSAGYALCDSEQVLIQPQCCCDFSNLESWEELVKERSVKSDLWIGHPQPLVEALNEVVKIREGWEGAGAPDYLRVVSTTFADLQIAVDRAKKETEKIFEAIEEQLVRIINDATLRREICNQIFCR
ncbi:hypothetical protein [Calycomorphotria hydatis]|uniref:Uncharacterized protein n=1 Tax=Calycomorphotria hydatis TaxID=2528027 RepID=A0A517T8N9_9PLAN|nr:hypothetical protein [Calycomorphotria hydatis]QDT64736.1 hypothetical protein V22_19770 [Calycomorphotria hydatis]